MINLNVGIISTTSTRGERMGKTRLTAMIVGISIPNIHDRWSGLAQDMRLVDTVGTG